MHLNRYNRIYYWTAGHPYLTQKLCLEIAESTQTKWSNEQIDRLAEKTFFEEPSHNENNIQFVRDFILNHPRKNELLKLYRRIYKNRKVFDDGKSPLQSQLKLSGLVKVEHNQLVVRNEINRRAFDSTWIETHIPINWQHLSIGGAIIVVIFATVILIYNSIWLPSRAESAEFNFYKTEDPKVHCESLARLFSIQPLFGPNYENKAFNLFFDEPNSLESQREIYEACSNNSQDFILIVRKTYVTGVTQ